MRQLHAGVFAGCLGTTLLVTAGLIVLGALSPDPPSADGIIYLSGFLAMALAGCVLAGFRPRNAIAWVFLGGGAGTLLAALLSGVAAGGIAGAPASAWLNLVSLELYGVGWVAVTTLPLLLFPDGRPRGVLAQAGVVVAIGISAVVAVAIAVGAQADDPSPASPFAVAALGAVPRQVLDAALLLAAALSIGAAVLLAVRWQRAGGRERRQLAWMGVAALVLAGLIAISWVTMTALPDLPDVVGASVEALQIAVIPVAMLASILDAQLFDIDVVFRRSLVFGVLTVLVSGIYAAAIALASLGAGRAGTVIGVLAASVVAAFALAPAKEWLSRLVETRLYGSRRRPEEAIALVGHHLGSADLDPGADATLAAAATALGETLRLGSVRIELSGPEPMAVEWRATDADSPASPSVDPVELELQALGATEGRLLVTAGEGDVLTTADIGLLRQLAPQIALIAHAVRAAASVQRSRELIVGAREAERRRLRRDLHDGLGPALVGLALQTDSIGPLIPDDPDRAAELSTRVAEGLRGVIADVRAAVDGLRPADLDQLGLAGALAERVRSLAAGGLDVDLQCDVTDLPPATEVAAYRIVTEALTNVVRHAAARACRVRVTLDDGSVDVLIEDDGVGFETDAATAGVGLESMRARAEEIGGRLVVSSGSPGTTIEAWLPAPTLPLAQPQTPVMAGL